MEQDVQNVQKQTGPLRPKTGEVGTGTVTMEVFTDFASCGPLARAWDSFVERISGDIFLTFDWQRIWWKYYGRGRSLRVYLFRADEKWVGLVPMFTETVRLGPLWIRQAKMVGSGHSSFGHFRPAIEPAYLRPILRALAEDLEDSSCDQVILGPMAGRYAQYPFLLGALREGCAGGYRAPREKTQVQTYYSLGENFEEWVRGLTSSQRSVVRRDYRNLEKQSLSFTVEEAGEETWEEMFDEFIRFHQSYWNGQGKLGHFRDWPQSPAFHREVARAQVKRGRLLLLRLRCSDGSRAYAYNYRCGGMYFNLLLARTTDSPTGVSVSRLLHSEMVKHAVFESVRWIDAMRGKYEYKLRLGGECYPLRTITLNRGGLLRRIRMGLFCGAAKLFHLVYYKIYFCRLGIRIPPRYRRGLWESWIRACGNL
jgi:CelD/BcsL family acetyltransferase involved in cellulose biosynthesis